MENGSSTMMFGPPTTMDMVFPPAAVLIITILGLLLFSIITQPRWWKSKCCRSQEKVSENDVIEISNNSNGTNGLTKSPNAIYPNKNQGNQITSFFQTADLTEIDKFLQFQNNPISLFLLSLPFLMSLVFCPVTFYIYMPLVDFFWPKEFVAEMPKINDVVAAFLMPAGLVYAIAFGFAFAAVLTKKDSVENSVETQSNLLQQMWELIKCSSAISPQHKLQLCLRLKEVIVGWMTGVIQYKSKRKLATPWHIITTIEELKVKNNDDAILGTLFGHTLQLQTLITSGCFKDQRGISILEWLFMITVGFISYFGILMIKADSYRFEVTICIMTVFSISAFSYILSDIDSPYHGIIRVDLTVFADYLNQMKEDYDDILSDSANKNAGVYTDI